MVTNVYAVKDTLVGFFPPVVCNNDQAMIRQFSAAVVDENSQLSKICSDVQLFKLGSFDDQTGDFTSDVVYLCKGADFVGVEK